MSEASRWFSVEDKTDRIVIRLMVSEIPGEDGVDEVGKVLDAVFDRSPGRRLELDISALTFVSSAFLGRLISFHRRIVSAGRTLQLTGVLPDGLDFL